jgi:hypothetical protein
MREKRKGKRPSPGTGYRNPKVVRGLHPSGKEIVRVFNTGDLENVNIETQIAQIGSTVGTRKRLDIINFAEEMEIHIINPQIRRDIEEDDEEIGLLDEELIEDEDLSDEEVLLDDDEVLLEADDEEDES